MADHLVHAFTSPKSDSPDASIVSSSEWNTGHYLTGGQDRQHVTYLNAAAPHRIRYVDGVQTYESSRNIITGTALPTAGNNITVVNATEVLYIAVINIQLFVISAGTNCTVSLRVGGGSLELFRFQANTVQDYTFIRHALITSAGTSNFDLNLAGPGGSTITQGVVKLTISTFGR